MARSKLTEEQRLDLHDLLTMPGLRPLIIEMENLAESYTDDVLKLNLSNDSDEKQLIRLKCRAEGAHSFLAKFKTKLETLRAKKES